MSDADSDDMRTEVLAWLHSSHMDKTAEYLKAGRCHAALSDDELIRAWRASFKLMAAVPRDSIARKLNTELQIEIEQRGKTVPFDLVSDEVETLSARTAELVEDLQENDPGRWDDIAEEVGRDVTDFETDRKKPKN